MHFTDRLDAGRRLAGRLMGFRGQDVVVLGLPRGGVPVASEVAKALDAPLDVILVRKLGVPLEPELGMGAIGEGGARILNRAVLRRARLHRREIEAVEECERAELERRARVYRGGRPRLALGGRTALIVDDGVATGSTARAACRVARAAGASRVVFAAPVAAREALRALAGDADEVIVLHTPETFWGIGQFYDEFRQLADDEVVAFLSQAAGGLDPAVTATAETRRALDTEVVIPTPGVDLQAHLVIPGSARGVVIFVHGTGSNRNSSRNRHVASVLNRAGLGTLLFDLLTSEEASAHTAVFDIQRLARRLGAVVRWLRLVPEARGLPVGFFGSSTGAAAALVAASGARVQPAAIVSRGGRPDLAGEALGDVRSPTLLIVGGNDLLVLGRNREAQARLRCECRLEIVPDASHLFEEPGTLDRVAALARDWFVAHLGWRDDRPKDGERVGSHAPTSGARAS